MCNADDKGTPPTVLHKVLTLNSPSTVGSQTVLDYWSLPVLWKYWRHALSTSEFISPGSIALWLQQQWRNNQQFQSCSVAFLASSWSGFSTASARFAYSTIYLNERFYMLLKCQLSLLGKCFRRQWVCWEPRMPQNVRNLPWYRGKLPLRLCCRLLGGGKQLHR